MKRYETFLNKDCGRPFADIEEDANGGLVMYDDAMEEIAHLNARVAELHSALDQLVAVVGLTAFKYEHQAKVLQEAVDHALAVLKEKGSQS